MRRRIHACHMRRRIHACEPTPSTIRFIPLSLDTVWDIESKMPGGKSMSARKLLHW